MQSIVGPSESIKLWMAHQDFKNKSDGPKYSHSEYKHIGILGILLFIFERGQESSDGPNPSQSDIFPEKYTQCRQQFYLHSRPRKPWEKTLQVWPTLHLFFLPNHHKWTNATSLCKQDILSLNHSTSINHWWNSLYYSRFNHSTYRGNLKWQINSEIRTFK